MMQGLHGFLLSYLLTCLGENILGSEIIRGKKVPDDLMLYMASVQNTKGTHICGGFLISEDFVLTAAHCNKHEPTSVVLGTHNLKTVRDSMRFSVKRCIYPRYVKPNNGDDIMLLKLTRKPRLNNRIQPIQLPKADNKVKDNRKCRVAGWGLTKTRGATTDVLQVAEVPFTNLKVCKAQWKKVPFDLPANVTCAGGYSTDRGFCQGDSGGPLVCGAVAVGVASFNMRQNCDYPNVPNVYTDVTKYLPWIKNILRKKKC